MDRERKIGIVIHNNDEEMVWNAFRLGNFALKQNQAVKVFLLGKGVEAAALLAGKFDVNGQMQAFVDAGGEILACGTCLKLRQQHSGEICSVSTMKDLYDIILESDKLISF